MTNDTTTTSPMWARAYGTDKAPVNGEGDLLYDTSFPPSRAYTMRVSDQPLKGGGVGDVTVYVTHIYKDGAWLPIDEDKVGLILRVSTSHEQSLAGALQTALRRAFYNNPIAQHLSQSAINSLVDSVTSALGLPDTYGDKDETNLGVIDVEGLAGIRKAITDLLEYAPENSYWPALGEMGAEADGVGFAQDADEYNNLINGKTDGFGIANEGRRHKALPMLSQPVYYAVMGSKDGGRSMKARINALLQAAGMDE